MRRFLAGGAVLLTGLALAATGTIAAPLNFNTALPVAKGEFVLRQQFIFARASGAGREREERAAISVIGYGAAAALTLFAEIPFVDRSLDSGAPGGRLSRSASGLGDITLSARYTVFRRDGPGRTFRLAPFVGLKLPTGRSGSRDSFGTLPPEVQNGTGSWDPFSGLVLTYQTLEYQIDAQAAYRANTRAGGFEAGDVARADISFQYRLLPRLIESGTPGFLYGVAGANLRHRGRSSVDGAADKNSGGTVLFLSPGLQYVTKRWIIEFGAQLPVARHSNGSALEDDFVLRVGARLNF